MSKKSTPLDRLLPPLAAESLRTYGEYMLHIVGDALLPTFRDGDTVIIDPKIAPEPGDFVAALCPRFGRIFGQLCSDGSHIEHVSPNPDELPLRSDITTVLILGTMVERRRIYRRLDDEEPYQEENQ